MTDRTAATPEPPQQPGNATNQRAASEAKNTGSEPKKPKEN